MTTPSAAARSERAENNGFVSRAGFEPFEVSGAEQSIVQRFSEVARRRSGATAVVSGHTAVTYEALLTRASSIGTALRDQLGTCPGPVILRLPAGAVAIEALLGVLFSGRSYLFLPPDTGLDAMGDMIAAVVPAALIVDGEAPTSGVEATDHARTPTTIALAGLTRGGGPVVGLAADTQPGDLACLFATSGTTGTPKIVGLSHRAVLFDIGRQTNDLYLGPDDRIDLLCHPSFSASLASIFTALLTGAELHVLDVRDRLATLGTWLTQSGITISTMTVSTLRALCATLPPGDAPPRLRLISVGGEPMLAKDVAAFCAAFPSSCVLQNAMASTETRTYAQYFVPRAAPRGGSVPIGWPVFAKDVVVLGPNRVPVVAGQPGEIAVRSRYLAQGYVNSPSLTAERFLPQPDGSVLFLTGDRGSFRQDGCLMFHGRVDSLVKIRGYRVEPGAVEEALVRDSRVRQAAVVVREPSGREPHLVAYVVLEAQTPATAEQLLDTLASRLPAYAVPSALVFVESLPVTPNGKTDYRALGDRNDEEETPASSGSASAGTAASLLQIWSDVLGHSDFGTEDSFFERGGDSLNAIRVQLRVHQRFGVDLPLEVLVRYPSVNRLTEWLTDHRESDPDAAALVLLHPGGTGLPLFCVPGIGGEVTGCRPLAERLGSDRPVYGLRTTAGAAFRGQDVSVESLAAAHLRAIDTVIARDTPALICGHSFGAIVAFEMAHQLKAAGRPLGLLSIIDMPLSAGHRQWWRRGRDVLVNLPVWLRYDVLETDWITLAVRGMGKSALMWRQLRAAARHERATTEPDLRAYFGRQDVPIEMKERLTARLDALERYRLRPLPGTVVLFRARAQALFGRNDRRLGWDGLATAVDVCDVPGHHDSCANEPHVARLAELLSARLAAVRSSGP